MVIGRLKKRIVLIEENDKLREGLAFTIESNRNCLLVNAYAFCYEAVKSIHRDAPDVIIMDISCSDADGVECLRMIKSKCPAAEIIIFTDVASDDILNEVLAIGISGYFLKSTPIANFLDSLELVVQGGAVLSPLIAKKVLSFFHINPHTPLSDRETEVLRLITHGKTYSEIANDLSISIETSKTHIKNIYKKLNVKSKSQAVKKALNDKLIHDRGC